MRRRRLECGALRRRRLRGGASSCLAWPTLRGGASSCRTFDPALFRRPVVGDDHLALNQSRGCSSANGGGGFGSEVSNANGGRAVGRCGATFGGSGFAVGGGGGSSAWIGGADGRGSDAGVWGGGPGAGTDPAELAAPDPPRSGCGDVWPPATGPDWAASGWPTGGDEREGMAPCHSLKSASYHSDVAGSTSGGV